MKEFIINAEEKSKNDGPKKWYQYLITGVFTLQFCCSHFVNYSLPYLERIPDVLTSLGTREQLTFEICENKIINYTIIPETVDSSIVNDFEIYCNKSKIYFISIYFYVGIMIGAFISFLFIDKIGSQITILIFIPIYCFILSAFKCLKPNYPNYCLYLIYSLLFLLGFVDFIIIIALLTHICEIVKPSKIPIFVITICIGISLSGLLNCIIFHASSLDWRDVFIIFVGINIMVYIIIFITFIFNPIPKMNNDLVGQGRKTIIKEFKDKINQNLDFDNLNNNINVYDNNIISTMNKSGNNANGNFYNDDLKYNAKYSLNNNTNLNNININNIFNTINNHSTQNLSNILQDTSPKIGNNKVIKKVNEQIDIRQNLFEIDDRNTFLIEQETRKEDDLLIERNNLIQETSSHKTERNFTPLDLVLFSSQKIYYLILCFLWIINVTLRNGIDLANKYVNHNIENITYPLTNYILDIVLSLFLLLLIKIYHRTVFHTMMVSLQIANFITFLFITYFLGRSNKTCINIFFLLTKIFCHGLYSLLYVIICTIYPILIRTKGLGCNVSASCIGAFITCILVENLGQTTLILYFMVFEFFSMMMTYSLPKKIGAEILDNNSIEKKHEDDDDIFVGNVIRITAKDEQLLKTFSDLTN